VSRKRAYFCRKFLHSCCQAEMYASGVEGPFSISCLCVFFEGPMFSFGDSVSYVRILTEHQILSAGGLVIYFHIFTEDDMLSVGDYIKFVA
jgi:hypothetical protein